MICHKLFLMNSSWTQFMNWLDELLMNVHECSSTFITWWTSSHRGSVTCGSLRATTDASLTFPTPPHGWLFRAAVTHGSLRAATDASLTLPTALHGRLFRAAVTRGSLRAATDASLTLPTPPHGRLFRAAVTRGSLRAAKIASLTLPTPLHGRLSCLERLWRVDHSELPQMPR